MPRNTLKGLDGKKILRPVDFKSHLIEFPGKRFILTGRRFLPSDKCYSIDVKGTACGPNDRKGPG